MTRRTRRGARQTKKQAAGTRWQVCHPRYQLSGESTASKGFFYIKLHLKITQQAASRMRREAMRSVTDFTRLQCSVLLLQRDL